MQHLLQLSLLVFAVVVVAGLAAAGVQGLAAWRAVKSFKRTAPEGMLATAALIEQLEARSAGSADRAARLARARTELHESLAEAAVIGAAAGEVWSLFERARILLPSK